MKARAALRIAVTGAGGFVGSHVARVAIDRGHAVVAVTRPGGPRVVQGESRSLVEVNLEDSEGLDERLHAAFSDVDSVVHAAAYVPRDYTDRSTAERCFRVNALAADDVVRAAGAAGVRSVVLLSTAAVYALSPDSATETSSAYPTAHAPYYAGSKLCGELLARHAADRRGISLAVLRLGSVYGPGMPTAGVLTHFLDSARNGRPITVQGGDQLLDFVYVQDVAQAVVRSAELRLDGILNISSGEEISVQQLAETVKHAVNPAVAITVVSAGSPLSRRRPIAIERARSALDFSPRTFAKGLTEMLEDAS